MARVLLKDVTKYYDKDVLAVNKVNIEVNDKELMVFVGPSGCGKSTTLRMIAGLEEISDGEIYIGERIVNDVPPKSRDIAMVFQNYALYPHMNVYDNMAFALQLRKVKKAEIDARVREAAKILGIETLLQRKPKQLSGGQRQRVAIGRAIVRDPHVFLMDEPLSNLDAKLRNQMRSEIIKLHRKLDATMIYVTHDQTEAMTLGDRIVVMKNGMVHQIDTPQNIFRRPVNIFVAGFIGTPQMNFFDQVELKRNKDGYYIRLMEKHIRLCDEAQEVLRKKELLPEKIVVGIRPEDVEIDNESPVSVQAAVDVCELMGSEVYLHVNFHSDNPNLVLSDTFEEQEKGVAKAVLRLRADHNIRTGQTINVRFREEHIHLFNCETQYNLLFD